MAKSFTQDNLSVQLRELELAAARSTNSCLVAKYIALSDERVQDLFLKKISDGNVFHGVSCLSGIGIPEYKRVYFDFDCPFGSICFIKPAFLVVVNVVDETVVSIIAPYIPRTDAYDEDAVTRSVSIEIDIQTRSTGSAWCVKIKVKVNVSGLGSGTVSLPEVCLGADGACARVNSGGGDVRAEAEVCWRGKEICAEVTGKIKLFGRWYEASARECVKI